MPFTFSHPAIILPLAYLPKKWYSMTGLIIGSLAPDFEYFLRMRMAGHHSHTWSGLFWFDLPVAIILAFIFHTIVRHNLLINLPFPLKSRFMGFGSFNWNRYFFRNWPVVVISVLIGSISHLFWDSFTHEHGYFVNTIPALREQTALTGVPLYKLLQHGSTFAGGIAILLVIRKLPVDYTIDKTIRWSYWLVVCSIFLIAAGIRLLYLWPALAIGHVIVTLLSAGMIALVLGPVFLRIAVSLSLFTQRHKT